LTALPFSHPELFEWMVDQDQSDWIDRFEIPYEPTPPSDDLELRKWAARVMEEYGLEGSFGTHRPSEKRVNIWIYTFWSSTQVRYEAGRLTARDRRFRLDHVLTGMHARGGFHQESVLDDGWAFLIDLVCLAMLVWIVTGFYMWWRSRSSRFWGWIAISSGVVAFAIFLICL